MRFERLPGCVIFACAIALATAARGDDAADKLLAQVEKATQAVHALTADFTMTWAPLPGHVQLRFAKPPVSLERHSTGKVQFKRPNLACVETIQAESGKKSFEISDGRNCWQWDTAGDTCYKYPVEPHDPNITLGDAGPSFFNPDFSAMIVEEDATTRYLGSEKVDGIEYRVVEMIGLTSEIRWYIGPDDLVHRAHRDSKIFDGNQRFVISLSNLVIDGPVADESFRFDPPDGKKIVSSELDLETLLPLGSDAPDFELPLATGEKVSLAEIRKGHRLTIINHWNFGCGPCLVELPHLQKLYEKLAGKGVQIIAVHQGHARAEDRETEDRLRALNSRDAVQSYTMSRVADFSRAQKISFKMLVDTSGKVAEKYKANGWPTIYIVDENGKVVYRTLGYSTSRMRTALKTLGID
jgi:peroxiredoxin/outer membrane lipoprotein-sorting protein